MNRFEKCYTLSTRTAKLQAVRVVEELKSGKTGKAKALAKEQEAASAEYWQMKAEFKAAGILDEYEEYEDEKISNLI